MILYYQTGQFNISRGLIIINIYNSSFLSTYFIFITTGLIGKFGLFPANLGILGVLDSKSLFSCFIIMILSKYVQLITPALNIMPFIINPNIKDICSSIYIVLALVTLYHGISLNYKHFSVRKFIAASSMVNLGLIVASMIT